MTITERLLAAVEDSEATLYRIAKDSDITYSALHTFIHGGADLRLSTADKLAQYLELELTPRVKRRRKK